MWHVYNLIAEVSSHSSRLVSLTYYQGDEVRALTMRKINTVSSTGSSDSYRVRTHLTLQVVKVGVNSTLCYSLRLSAHLHGQECSTLARTSKATDTG